MKSRKRRRVTQIQSLITLTYLLVLLYNFFFGDMPILKRLQGVPFLMSYAVLSSLGWNVGLDIALMQWINSILNFERDLLQEGESISTSITTKLMFIFIYLTEFTVMAVPSAVCLLLMVDPCVPPFLLSFSPSCSTISWMPPGREIFVVLFEAWMALQLFSSGATWAFFIFFAGIVAMLNYFQLLESRICKAVTIFQNQACLKLYRSIQILEKYMNGCTMVRIVPSMVLCTPNLQIISQFVSIKLHSKIAMPGFLIFPLIMVDAVIVNVFVYTLASWVNSTSTKLLQTQVRRTVQFGGKKSQLAREIRACGVLKIKFGSNFIDNGTPLVIQNFCFNQTLNLLLISDGRKVGRR
ncbi:uncharacterized protein LOC118438863 [Folsomia candida]|uniref:uncharacterized protein LOC118438863 n=1 Tax=Folsomia candida TaxID=158441 RepID=UPI001604A605|nr:uncharacterized protein LOC118438863 [Folsomia candida]